MRYQNRLVALALACPHQNAAVKWLAADGQSRVYRSDQDAAGWAGAVIPI